MGKLSNVLFSTLAIFLVSGCFSGSKISKSEKSLKKYSKIIEWNNDFKKRIEDINIYWKLQDNPEIFIKIYADTSQKKTFARTVNNFGSGRWFLSEIYLPPFKMSEKSDSEYQSDLYHELWHSLIGYSLWKHYYGKEKLPSWKYNYLLYENSQDPIEKRPGQELEAYFFSITYGLKEFKRTHGRQLESFFRNYFFIKDSELYQKSPEVRERLFYLATHVEKFTGYSPEDYINLLKKAKTIPNK